MSKTLSLNIPQAHVEKLHKSIMRILSEKGIKFESAKAREIFAKHGAKIDGEVVYISEELFKKALSTAPQSFKLKARNPKYDVEIGTGKTVYCPAYGPVYISRNNERKSGVKEDLINFTKLTETSTVLDVMTPYVLTPTDVNEHDLLMYQQAVCLKYGEKPTMFITAGYDITKKCIELTKKINQKNPDDYVGIGLISSLSPLAYDETMSGAIIALAEEKQPLILGVYGLLGATAPMTFFSAFCTTQAEMLAGVVLAQLINPGVPCISGNVSGGADMRFITPTIGSVEECKFTLYTKAMAEFYKLPCRGGGALSDAKEMDYSAGSESAIVMYSTLACGMDYNFHSVGIMDSFNIVCYEKFVLDEQNIEMINWILNVNEPTDKEIAYEVIDEVPHAEQYIQHAHTYENMRDSQYQPKYSGRGYYDSWEKSGRPSLLSQANKEIDKRLAEYVLPELDAEKTKLLDSYLNV